VLRVEVILGVIASALAIIAFMARAWANIRRGRRVRRLSGEIDARSAEEFRRLQEEIAAAQEMSARRRERQRPPPE
jgi:FtsZ-interacting cell division protein ZipA